MDLKPDVDKSEIAEDKRSQPKAERIDFEGMLSRMLSGLGVSTLAELARLFGVSAQALSNTRQRSTMPLTYLLRYLDACQKKTGVRASLDWVVFGDTGETVLIKCLSDSPTVPAMHFDMSLIRQLSVTPGDLRYFAAERSRSCFSGDTFLVDIADCVVRDGIFVFKVNEYPVVKQVKIKIDGVLLIGGEEVSANTVSSLVCLGRAVWRGTTSVDPG